jgi:endonuclease/exonuclease/phosphatase family metal-dependent hydrolase
LDLAWKGRSFRRVRFGVAAVGLAAVAWSAYTMNGNGDVDDRRPGDRGISVLHWNVQWGGGLFRGPRTWRAQRAAMLGAKPDVIVLSEAPPGAWIEGLVADLGAGASSVEIRQDPASPHWYGLAVCSRWPLRMERQLPLPGGVGMSVVAELEGRRLRMLVVDGLSSPTRSRRPFLASISAACREAEAAGRPFDLIVGDFNTPSRSLGFDELAALGYRLAGRSARGWRGTFPARLPVYDIDHIWRRAGLRLALCRFFNGPYTDHRGQVVELLLPEDDRE